MLLRKPWSQRWARHLSLWSPFLLLLHSSPYFWASTVYQKLIFLWIQILMELFDPKQDFLHHFFFSCVAWRLENTDRQLGSDYINPPNLVNPIHLALQPSTVRSVEKSQPVIIVRWIRCWYSLIVTIAYTYLNISLEILQRVKALSSDQSFRSGFNLIRSRAHKYPHK